MTAKRIFQSFAVIVILAASLVSTGGASAWSGCTGYVTAQAGDTVSAIAAACGVTVEAIQTANPGLGDPLAAGQVLYIPTALNSIVISPSSSQTVAGTYIVQQGDTLGDIAAKFGVSLSDILTANPQITINPGQVINLPAAVNLQPSTNNFISMTFPFATSPAINYPSTITDVSQYSVLRVTYGQGLIVRTGAGTNNPEIHSLLVSAMGHTHWWYRKNSATVDSIGMVWVEIQLPQQVNGSSTGWIMVKDMLGNYFTVPNIDQ